MRRILVSAATILLLAGSATAAEWRVGFQAGANYSGLNGQTASGVSLGRKSGLLAGAVGEVRLSGDAWLSLQPMYLQRGTSTLLAVAGEVEKIEGPTVSMDYLAMPVVIKIMADNGRTYVTGGLNPAFLLDAQLQNSDTIKDVGSQFSDFALAADIGLGFMVPLGQAVLNLEFRYEQSVLNLASSDPQEGDDLLPARYRSTGFQFLAGLTWPLGGK